jgi:hypothetical protein
MEDNMKKYFLYSLIVLPAFFLGLNHAQAAVVSSSPVVTATSTCSTGLSCGLVGYWTFDGKDMINGVALDKSGNGRTGVLGSIATSTFYVQGKIGQAANFSGSQNVTITTPTATPPGVTMSAWVYVKEFSGNGAVLSYNSNTNIGLQMVIDSIGRFRTFSNATAITGPNPSVVVNKWYLVTSVWDGTNISEYIDGVLKAGPTAASLTLTNNTTSYISGGAGSTRFKGIIDDARIYNRALSVAEIKQLYALGASTKQAVSPSVTSTSCTTGLSCGLVGYWTFDGKDMINGVALDKSGNGKTASPANISTTTFYTNGKIGQGLRFDGVDDYVNVGNVSSSVKSISFWIKASNTTKKIIDLNGTASIEVSGGTITANSITSPTIYVNGSVSSTITANQWYLVSITTGTAINVSALDIGRISSGYFVGTIDDVRVYNRTLSVAEIKQLYALGASTKQAVSPSVTSTSCTTGLSCGLVGYWTFDGKDMINGVALDKSGNGKTASPANISTTTFYTNGKIGQGLRFDGVDDYVNVGNVSSSVKSISFWVNANSLTQSIATLSGTASISVTAGTISADGFTSPTIYVDKAVSSTLTSGWHLITITTGTAVDTSTFKLGTACSLGTTQTSGGNWYTDFSILAQKIKISSSQDICRIDIALRAFVAGHTLSLRTDKNGGGSLLGTSDVGVSTGVSGPSASTWYNYTFSTPVTLSSDAYINEKSGIQGITWVTGGDVYQAGSGYNAWNGASELTTEDFTFKLYTGSSFSGVLDDVRLYNRALSATEVIQLYNSGR